jgi:hypothetical protein
MLYIIAIQWRLKPFEWNFLLLPFLIPSCSHSLSYFFNYKHSTNISTAESIIFCHHTMPSSGLICDGRHFFLWCVSLSLFLSVCVSHNTFRIKEGIEEKSTQWRHCSCCVWLSQLLVKKFPWSHQRENKFFINSWRFLSSIWPNWFASRKWGRWNVISTAPNFGGNHKEIFPNWLCHALTTIS